MRGAAGGGGGAGAPEVRRCPTTRRSCAACSAPSKLTQTPLDGRCRPHASRRQSASRRIASRTSRVVPSPSRRRLPHPRRPARCSTRMCLDSLSARARDDPRRARRPPLRLADVWWKEAAVSHPARRRRSDLQVRARAEGPQEASEGRAHPTVSPGWKGGARPANSRHAASRQQQRRGSATIVADLQRVDAGEGLCRLGGQPVGDQGRRPRLPTRTRPTTLRPRALLVDADGSRPVARPSGGRAAAARRAARHARRIMNALAATILSTVSCDCVSITRSFLSHN